MNAQIHSGQMDGFKYQQVVNLISEQLDQGSLRPGDRLPSLRHLSSKLKVSVPTVRQAYLELERQGQISARPKSGYFIEARRKNRLVSGRCKDCKPVEVECRDLIDQVYDAIHQADFLPLGIANPTMALPATKTLNRAMKRVMSRAEARTIGYASTTGEPGLRRPNVSAGVLSQDCQRPGTPHPPGVFGQVGGRRRDYGRHHPLRLRGRS